ncbi:DUF3443 domain-containing protein [Caballeronia humi]|uniref:Lipoprotein n=1 Tax=Caballeronia humi TaxID=326474 RepID=A0A158FKJ4_9BURK|nr:DUF3443 domain-containing protein [Caballeronia humi]SAL20398.1 lipoprotein [Caballeronia humi]
MQFHRRFLLAAAILSTVMLSGCGGGGGSDGSNSTAPASAAPASSPTAASASQPAPPAPPPDNTVAQSTTPNVQPIRVSKLVTNTRNILMTSVTVCVPGTDDCQIIDNIQVDTGSQGLRILASALAPLALPAVTTSDGSNAAQCTVFGSGYTWGAVRTADIKLAGHVARATSIQAIADPAVPAAAADCTKSGLPMLSVDRLRSNGILGVGPFSADCGGACASAALPRWYYACASGNCTASTLPVVQQVTNPVARFPADNNGVLIELPAVPDGGASSVAGTMTFGIGSQSNNLLGDATVLKGSALSGFVSTNFDGSTFSTSFIDSGSNGLFFPSKDLKTCGFWYCPPSPTSLTATLRSASGVTRDVSFAVSTSTTLFASGNNAFSNLAGPVGNYFDWGLPFFYGRRVFTAFEGRVTPAGKGPYYAF